MCGPMPTPAVAYLTRALRLTAGVVISASHNPYPDNGIKFFSGDGFKLPDDTEARIEAEMEQPMGCNEAAKLGKVWRVDDAPGRYIEFCKSTFPSQLDLKGLKIVVDCAHGAAYHVAPHVFHELGADVIPIGVEPDGFNINDGFGATSPDCLKKHVLERKRTGHCARRRRRPRPDGGRGRAELRRRPAALRDRQAPLRQAEGGGRGGNADDQLRLREGDGAPRDPVRARQGRRPLRARADARERAGSSAARTPATSSASTSTPPATASSRRCRCSGPCGSRGRRSPSSPPSS